jgi:hypothetical protein
MEGTADGLGVDCAGCGKRVRHYFVIVGKGDFCSACAPVARYQGKSTFPFTTTNINGKSIEVQSLKHLRSLEKEHGVQSFAYNMDNPEAPRHNREVREVRK